MHESTTPIFQTRLTRMLLTARAGARKEVYPISSRAFVLAPPTVAPPLIPFSLQRLEPGFPLTPKRTFFRPKKSVQNGQKLRARLKRNSGFELRTSFYRIQLCVDTIPLFTYFYPRPTTLKLGSNNMTI